MFSYLSSLPDPILIKAIELFFIKYNMNDNLSLLIDLKKKHKYEIMRSKYVIVYGIDTDEKHPHVYMDCNAINNETSFELLFFKQQFVENIYNNFNIYYSICLTLNRKTILNSI
jgi:hypothetical protein